MIVMRTVICAMCFTSCIGPNLSTLSVTGSSSSSTAGASSPGVSTSCPSTGTATVANVLATKTFVDSSGALATGTMTNHGAFNLTGAFSGAGYVSSLTGLTVANVCSSTNLLGSAGTAVCLGAAGAGTIAAAGQICSNYYSYNGSGTAVNGTRNCPDIGTPSTIAGLKLWLKADAIEGVSDSGSVTVWLDSSGNNNHAVAWEISTRTPTYLTNQINSKPVVRFDGVDDVLRGPWLSFSSLTAFIVVKVRDQTTDWQRIMALAPNAGNDYNQADGFEWPVMNTDNQWKVARNGASGFDSGGINLSATTAFQLMGITFTAGGAVTVYHDGVSSATTTDVNASAVAATRYYIGAGQQGGTLTGFGTEFAEADYAEIIIYNTPLSNANRQAVECYLSNKYALGLAGC